MFRVQKLINLFYPTKKVLLTIAAYDKQYAGAFRICPKLLLTRWYTNINIRPPTKGALTLLD